ncbi:MAG: NTP transferase domain-containing protein [Acidobacteria bacterium]|nr:NTP transferase domain-containing protein [Acidobacteriota bacterium]
MAAPRPLIGLVPAAGRATRLGDISGCKELLRVPGPAGDGEQRPVAEYLLRAMAQAGVERAYIVLRHGKWDIPARFGPALPDGPRLAYLVTPGTASIPATLDVAYPFVRDANVVTGFPDSCFTPGDAVARAVCRHLTGGAGVTLALFRSDRPDKTDMVELDGGRVSGFRVKPGPSELEYTFGAAVWGPELTEFMHALLAQREASAGEKLTYSELQISEVLGAALAAGIVIDADISPAGRYVDVGTPEDLARVRRTGAAD